MDTDQLIATLVAEGPRKPLPHPLRQAVLWLGGMMLYLAALAGLAGLRPDFAARIADPLYGAELILLGALAFSAALAALCLSRPDGHQMPWIKYIPLGFIIAWAGVALSGATLADVAWPSLTRAAATEQFDCPWHILLFSLPPGVAIFLIVRLGAPIQCCWAGGMATGAVTAFGYLCMRLIEPTDNIPHLLVWHALPILLICLMGMMIGKYALRWR